LWTISSISSLFIFSVTPPAKLGIALARKLSYPPLNLAELSLHAAYFIKKCGIVFEKGNSFSYKGIALAIKFSYKSN
jgi:hypothetical protein